MAEGIAVAARNTRVELRYCWEAAGFGSEITVFPSRFRSASLLTIETNFFYLFSADGNWKLGLEGHIYH